VVNGATLTEDRNSNENSSFTFDGVDDRISLGNTMQDLGASYTPVSFSFWFRTNVGYINGLNNSNGTLISDYKRDGICCENAFLASIKIDSNPTRLSYNCGEFSNDYISQSYSENYLNDTWFHVAIVKDGAGTQELYVNGLIEDQDTYNPNFDYSQQNPPFEPDWQFGAERWNDGSYASDYIHFYKGQIDDIAIYNRALTPAEITQLYTAAEEPVATCAPLAPNLQNGLVGYWPFCGNANDESGNGNNGVVNGATLAEDRFGNVGNAYSFDGVDDDILLDSNVAIGLDRSIYFWARVDSGSMNVNPSRNLISLGNDFNITFGDWGQNDKSCISVHSENGWIADSTIIDDGNWHFYVVSVSQGNSEGLMFYQDGVLLDGRINYNEVLYFESNSAVKFGNGYTSGDYLFGQLDEVGILNRLLTPEEITQLYTGIAPCNLIASETQDTPVEVGGSAQLYVTLNATDYNMQWQTNAAGLGWMDVQDNNTYTGSQTQNLLISNASLANHEQPFRIIVKDGICNDTSDVAMLIVNNTCTAYDTITNVVEVFDTLTIENVIDVFDTTTVFNTVEVFDTLTVYNTVDVFDTTEVLVEVFDTITNFIDVFDTTTIFLQVDLFDTLFIDVYDTTYVTLTDTTFIQVIDTAYVTVTDTLLIDITFVGFEGQPSWLNTVLVFPNPASDHITIDYGNFALMAGYNTVITDAAGATVYSSAVNTQQATIDINAWGSAGVYYMSIYDVNGAVVAVRQIVIQ
jgi:hypothetical protein